MSRGFYAAASAMMSDMTRFDVVANNLSNINTTGFKRSQSIHHDFRNGFIQRIHRERQLASVNANGDYEQRSVDLPPARLGELGTGTLVQHSFDDFSNGTLTQTEGSFDVGLQGEGFFVVAQGAQRLLTRSGAFQRNNEGLLVNASGLPVMGQNGPITISDRYPLSVTEDGALWQNGEYLDSLRIENVDNPQLLLNQGSQLYAPLENQDTFVVAPQVKQGYLEHSNVDVATEMVTMISALRAYQISQKALQSEDDMTGKAVNTLGRVGN